MSGGPIEVQIVADSLNQATGDRLTSFLLTYPRYIHAELGTHRSFSRSSASSRAIPTSKLIDVVRTKPAMPVEWGRNQSGMQAGAPVEGIIALNAEAIWREAAHEASRSAEDLAALGLHKQVVNRVLEPFLPMTTLVTATEWENFFALRCSPDAQPEFQALADAMLFAYVEHEPVTREPGEWHLPFDPDPALPLTVRLKVATARCARTSYAKFDGEFTVEQDTELHDRLTTAAHMSPTEHSARAMMTSGPWANFRGWRQYRAFFPGENRRVDLHQLAAERRAAREGA